MIAQPAELCRIDHRESLSGREQYLCARRYARRNPKGDGERTAAWSRNYSLTTTDFVSV
jgi:hypothetical protein